jgi:hypothetical protein
VNANELADALQETEPYYSTDYKLFDQAATMLRQQQAEIERLIGLKPITYGMLTFCKNCGEQNPYQAKTLTDEEIWAIASEIEPVEIQWGVRLSNELNVLDFARAILRKAQEK